MPNFARLVNTRHANQQVRKGGEVPFTVDNLVLKDSQSQFLPHEHTTEFNVYCSFRLLAPVSKYVQRRGDPTLDLLCVRDKLCAAVIV
jgi:hypothetical protein